MSSVTRTPPEPVVWHDVECGRYAADLPLWRELAAASPPRVLDVGAGTGRVALDLARAGHAVTALDVDADLLAELGSRAAAAGLAVAKVVADAVAFTIGPGGVFGLVAVPMQTLQLLAAHDRPGFYASARAALADGGRVAVAITATLEPFDATGGPLPPPDTLLCAGRRYVSQPLAVRVDADATEIERRRHVVGPDGLESVLPDVIRLHHLPAGVLAEEAAAAGLRATRLLHVAETDEHVGSDVVVLEAAG